MQRPVRQQRVVLAVGLILVGAVSTGCDAGKEELDLRHVYGSLSEVDSASTDVVEFTPTGEFRIEGEPELQFAVTEVLVDSSGAAGTVSPGETMEIRQPKGDFSNIAPVVDRDESYVAYVKSWTARDAGAETDTGQFVIVGEQALWKLDGQTGMLVTPEGRLPERVQISEEDGGLRVTAQ